MNHLKIRPFAKLGFVFLGDCYKNCRNRNYSQFKQSWDNLFYLPVVISTTKSHHRFHMGHIQEMEQFVKVLVKLNEWICVTDGMDRTSSAPNILSTFGLMIRFIDFDPEYGIPSLVFYYSNWKFEARVKQQYIVDKINTLKHGEINYENVAAHLSILYWVDLIIRLK